MIGIFHNEMVFFKRRKRRRRGWVVEEIEIASICSFFL